MTTDSALAKHQTVGSCWVIHSNKLVLIQMGELKVMPRASKLPGRWPVAELKQFERECITVFKAAAWLTTLGLHEKPMICR